MRNKYIDNFFKYVVNGIILATLFTVACISLRKEQETLKALDKELSEDPISTTEMSDTSEKIHQLKKDIDDITNQILTTNVNIKMANICRHGLCYSDINYLEYELANYKTILSKKEEELKELNNHFKRL
jgi:chromosome segregation ATPase